MPPNPLLRRRDANALLCSTGLGFAWALAAAPAAHAQTAQRRTWPAGRATPPLALPVLDSEAFKLDQARGSPLLLNFWASWCEPCRAEMPSLQRLAQRHQAQGLRVLALNYRETDAAIRRYLAQTTQHPITLPILRDRDGSAAKAFGVSIFPSTVAISRQGQVLFSVVGEIDWDGQPADGWVAAML
jgi:thiol-disulfide isomerase/thioredoxin